MAEPSNAQPGTARRVPHPGPVAGDMERIFEAAREQREYRAEREEGDEKDIAQIKAVYAAEKLGLPVRIVPTYDWSEGFRYIVVTSKHATHVVYLTPESEMVSVREVYDDQGTPKGLAFLYRKQGDASLTPQPAAKSDANPVSAAEPKVYSADPAPESATLKRGEFGNAWPFKGDEATLTCRPATGALSGRPAHFVLVVADGKTYAVNGTAKGKAKANGWEDLDSLYERDASGSLVVTAEDLKFRRTLVDRGLALGQ